jgi:hypothetical protein
MACPQFVDERGGLQIWEAVGNVFNTADKACLFDYRIWLTNLHLKEKNM